MEHRARYCFLLSLLAFLPTILLCNALVRATAPVTFHHNGRTVDHLLFGNHGNEHCRSSEDEACDQEQTLCWGYEPDCSESRRLFVPRCDPPAKPWANSMEEKQEQFWNQGDFGYVKTVTDSMTTICSPENEGNSSLICSTNLRFCQAKGLFLDLTRFDEIANRQGDTYKQFRENIFRPGEIGGKCSLNLPLLRENGEHKSALQSWYAELEEFTGLDFNPSTTEYCDEVVTMPTVFIKLDAGVNLYHHYCDFFNLYASQHANGSFSKDINIVMWDTSYRHYSELFGESWSAFTRHPLKRLSDYAKKKTCFSNVMFPLLARMRRGLYFNTFVVSGCYGSGLMHAFSKFMISRMNITQEPVKPEQVRITLLSRSTSHRRILNENELVSAMKTVGFFSVRVVDYKYREMPFLSQVQSSHDTDIFIGIHGAGLTHLLFLPDWAAIFEIYNTEDERCYKDLARLRGVEYITWEKIEKLEKENEGKHPQLGTPHAKFTNYTFDVVEFMRLVMKLGDSVRERKREYYAETIFDHPESATNNI